VIQSVILQGMCAEINTADDMVSALLSFEFVKAFTCTYAASAGFLVVGLLVYGGIMLSIFLRTGDVRIPVVLTLLTGGAIIPQVAEPGVAVVGIALLISGAGVLTLLYYRYSR